MIKCNECKKTYNEKSKKAQYKMNNTTLARCPYCGNFAESKKKKAGYRYHNRRT